MFVSLIICCFWYHASVIYLCFENTRFFISNLSVHLNVLGQKYTYPTCQAIMLTKFFMVMPYICVSSVYDLCHVTVLVPRVLKWLLNFLKNLCSLVLGYPSLFMNTGVYHIIS
jgi:hypothetical protein